MSDTVLRVLLVENATEYGLSLAQALEHTPYGSLIVQRCPDLVCATTSLTEQRFDAVVFLAGEQEVERLLLSPALGQAVLESAVIVVAPGCGAQRVLRLVRLGVQDVLDAPWSVEVTPTQLARCVLIAVERGRIEREAREAYATDLATGLPNRQQLIEHMSQLLALRGREPAPMAVLSLRIEGFDTTEASLGSESANVLRRKVAVRLRSAVRASDVVAALGPNAFALLLASTDDQLDAERVALKLMTTLRDPYIVAGQQVSVAASVGISHYPTDGSEVGVLLRKAAGFAAQEHATGRDGFSNWLESSWGDTGAANDGVIPTR